jgi:hypothetical protein
MNNNNSLCKKSERERERERERDDGNFPVHANNVCPLLLGLAFVGRACIVEIHHRIR